MNHRVLDNAARVLPTARSPQATRCGEPAGRSGFTLIEVLVVIFILSILAAIVGSIAGYVMSSASRQETAATQKVLLAAIQAYYDAGNPKAYPPDHYGATGDPNESGKVLVNFLTGKLDSAEPNPDRSQTPAARAATEILLKLPQEAWGGDPNRAVTDGWRNAMRYERDGGLGGRQPVVISAGPNGHFGDPSNAGDPNGEDDIRSDESQ
ncbi:MAG: type II secretion system GspH family protein [Phycisphaerae bacterium]|nr:type II secretion system GspH family protein [Phycisphaerae bacterium]